MAEIILIGIPTMLFGVGIMNAWKESRCTSNDAWFHDWVRDDKVPEKVEKKGYHTKTSATFQCHYCSERQERVIEDTEEEERIFLASD